MALITGLMVIGANAGDSSGYVWHLPRGFPEPLVPAGNPMSIAKVALGRRLFFEKRLSLTTAYSCASCHDPARAFTDARTLAAGATGQTLQRNAMALVNVAYNTSYGWTSPNIRTLEAQMRQPLFNRHPVELGLAGREAKVIAVLSADAVYVEAFRAAFPGETHRISVTNIIRAIACYERTLISGDSPFDHYVFNGEHDALDADAKHGMKLFYSPRLGCANCHAGFNFTGASIDQRHHAARPSFARDVDSMPVRIPTLRNIALTAPYMHDGRYETLEAVIAHYETVATLPNADKRLGKFKLTIEERRALLAFLNSLTDEDFVQQHHEP